jgi:uncharacterized protein
MVEVRESVIPGAGRGLFTLEHISKDEIACVYTGELLRTAEAVRLKDKSYLMRLGPQVYVNAGDESVHGAVLARYINDCRNPRLYNVVFDKYPERGLADVRALRDIAVGEELYVDYGRWYWLKTPGSVLPG